MKKVYFALVLFLVLSLVAGCGQNAAPISEENVLKIGASVSLSGVDARSGEICQRAYDLWKDTVNAQGGIDVDGKKYKVEITYYDDKSETQTAVKLVEKLISEDEVQFLLAPFGSANVFAASAISEQYGVPMIAGQAASQVGMTLLVVEQDVSTALENASRAYCIENGRIVLNGNAKEMMNNKYVQEAFLGIA